MAIQKRSDDSAVKDPGECFVMGLGHPIGDYFLALRDALNSKSLRVSRAAPETNALWSIRVLKSFVSHTLIANTACKHSQPQGVRVNVKLP